MLNLKNWKKNLFRYESRPTEIQNLGYLIGTSIWITVSIAQGFTSPVLTVLSKVAHPVVWLVLFLSCCLYKYFSLKINKTNLRVKASKFSFVLWAAISYALWKDGGYGSFLFMYPIIAISEIWTYLNLSVKEEYRFLLNDISVTELNKEEVMK